MDAGSAPIAVVTGGAGSIGRAVVGRLAARGYRVAVIDIDAARIESVLAPLGADHLAFAGDLTDPRFTEHVADELATHGSVAALVNVAGISPKGTQGKIQFDEITWEDFRRVLEINTLAPFFLIQRLVPHMPGDGSASIVNILSIAARMSTGGPRGAAYSPHIASALHYGASKSALHNIQTGLARELAPRRIRVNGVAPGFIASEMTVNIPGAERDLVVGDIPWGRPGTPDEIAAAVEFLVSPDASYLTGAVIDVNGGWLPA